MKLVAIMLSSAVKLQKHLARLTWLGLDDVSNDILIHSLNCANLYIRVTITVCRHTVQNVECLNHVSLINTERDTLQQDLDLLSN